MNFKNVLSYNKRKDGTREVRIYAYLNGEKKYFPTNIRIQPSEWNDKIGYIKTSHPLHKPYNAKIRAERNRVEEHILNGGHLENLGDNIQGIDLLQFLNQYIREAENGQHGYTKGTTKTYKSLNRRVKEYAHSKGLKTIPFDKVNMSFYTTFCSFLIEHCNCNKAGMGKHIKKLKRVMQVAMERKLHNNATFKSREFKAPTHKTSKIYLTETEIKSIESLKIKDASLERERDRFLLAYYLLMRFSDVSRVKKEGVFEEKGRKFYQYASKKTDTPTVIPIAATAMKLMEKHDYQFNYTSNQVANRYIKKVAAMAGITQNVDGKPKNELITLHTARRSAATNLRLQGASLKTIADLGGWLDINTLIVYLRASGLDSARLASGLEFFK